jgi:hypothetical protein
MKKDITFYLNGTVEERLPQLTTPESPLILDRKISDFYMFNSKDPILTHFFTYGSADSEIMTEDSLHIEAQKSLGFQSEICLSYDGCNLNSRKAMVFGKIMEYLIEKGIPTYMTATDESGDERLIRGYNPLTKTEIQNPNFKQTSPSFLE